MITQKLYESLKEAYEHGWFSETTICQAREAIAAYESAKSQTTAVCHNCDCTPDTMGTYTHHISVVTPWGKTVSVDACMVPELAALWRAGIRTVASCCGHKMPGSPPSICAHPDDVAKLDALGYERHVQHPHCHVAKTFRGPTGAYESAQSSVGIGERERFEAWAQKVGPLYSQWGDELNDGDMESIWNAALASSAEAEPAGWQTEDGRTISARQKADALRDGGASASSVKPYSIPLYSSPAPSVAAVTVPEGAREEIAKLRRQVISMIGSVVANGSAGGVIARHLHEKLDAISAMLAAAPKAPEGRVDEDAPHQARTLALLAAQTPVVGGYVCDSGSYVIDWDEDPKHQLSIGTKPDGRIWFARYDEGVKLNGQYDCDGETLPEEIVQQLRERFGPAPAVVKESLTTGETDRASLVRHAMKLMQQSPPWDGKTFNPELHHTLQLLAASDERPCDHWYGDGTLGRTRLNDGEPAPEDISYAERTRTPLVRLWRHPPAAHPDARDAARYRWLRDIQCNSVTVSYNDHAANYITAAQEIEENKEWFKGGSAIELEKMAAANSIWTVQIYPDTPVGFCAYNAATLDTVIDAAMGGGA